jgi:hypothetical protein
MTACLHTRVKGQPAIAPCLTLLRLCNFPPHTHLPSGPFVSIFVHILLTENLIKELGDPPDLLVILRQSLNLI